MSEYRIPDDAERAELAAGFAARETARDLYDAKLTADETLSTGTPVSMSGLFAYASGTGLYPDTEIEGALAKSPSLRAAYGKMLAARSVFQFEEARAASDGGPIPRIGQGCAIRYADSTAEPDQIYVIIEIDGDKPPPSQLVLTDAEDVHHRFALPAPRRGIIQMLVARASDLITLLSQPTLEIQLLQ